MAKEQGLALTGPDRLLKQLTKTVIETALDEELTEHLTDGVAGLARKFGIPETLYQYLKAAG